MFTRILIANRGEIACRVIRTARRMGIGTVAVYSDADARALHVRMADQAVRIGPAPAAQSYLDGAAIIAAAKASGAQAIHPGYGFLSENPDFVEAVEAAGLVFIGPSAASIRAMGLKDAAKRLMEKAGVPVVPGYHGEAQELLILAGKASEIGFPVLIKARAGGGGKGMRLVGRPEDFREALASARREAKASFGDDRVLVEKYIEKPRHVEVQVFGDKHGNVVHLFERDCSLQRRHQKVIEEAPAPGMTEAMRAAMTDAAVKAAQAIDYSGAGTIEFIVDGSNGLRPDGFWFMEMNTRLQVEHPVTEMITGLDLVEWQLRVAAGEKLPRTQDQIQMCGHAVEARIYAEDAARGFLPAIGTLHHLSFPAGVRIDAGVEAGDTVEPWYDPMIAKMIAQGADRHEALEMLANALDETQIAGCVTNAGFLARLARHEDFMAGNVDTGLIGRDLPQLLPPAGADPQAQAAAALAALGLDRQAQGIDPFERIGSWALWEPPVYHGELLEDGALLRFAVSPAGNGKWRVSLPNETVELALAHGEGGQVLLSGADGVRPISIARWPGHLTLFMGAAAHGFAIPDPFEAAHEAAGGDAVIAPMPGLVKIVHAQPGASLAKGAALLVLEAMKMEHVLTAPRDCVIANVDVEAGDQVTEGRLLVALLPEAGE
jgi:3-methylcrotonyl-CoA carboxylase alpha subunit